MSYTYLQEQGEESLVECFSDIPAFVLLRLNLQLEPCFCNANEMASSISSQSGTMLQPLMENRGEVSSISSVEDSPVKILVRQVREQVFMVREAASGRIWRESLAKLCRDTCLWKTPQCSLFEDLELSCEIWPSWGLMQSGECWGLNISTDSTSGKEYGFWPTPQRTDYKSRVKTDIALKNSMQYQMHWPLLVLKRNFSMGWYGLATPHFGEWLMGWPIGHTGCEPLAMDKFLLWLRLHGVSSLMGKTVDTSRTEA